MGDASGGGSKDDVFVETRVDDGSDGVAAGGSRADAVDDGATPEPTDALPADRIGDYFVLERVGAGAMGTVYAAYDPDLDRKVAIKVLRASHEGDSVGRVRLLREARALAKLDHPNVVTVHQVGLHDGHPWVAMAFVDGEDLSTWMRAERRGWREVLDVYLAAARGLAAAHAAGVVHRDFKPGNVLIGGDGKVMVADFGLARPAGDVVDTAITLDGRPGPQTRTSAAKTGERVRGDSSPESLGAPSSWSDQDASLTVTRGVVGTPMYMAPEQHLGSKVGPAADQYAFCLSLYEGLYGALPFDTSTMFALLEAKQSADVAAAPAGREVPRWLRRIVVKGLAASPAERHPDMAGLVAAVERELDEQAGRGRRRWVIGGLAAAVTVAGLGGWLAARPAAQEDGAPIDPCADAATSVDDVWNESARSRLRAAIEGVDVPFAANTADAVEARLERHVDALAAAHEQRCRDEVEGTAHVDKSKLRSECLSRAERRVSLVLEALEAPSRASLERAGELMDRVLEPPARCLTPSWVVLPESPALASEREEVRLEVARYYAMTLAAREEQAEALEGSLRARLETVADPGARGELRRVIGGRTPPEDPRRVELLNGAMADGLRIRDFALALMSGLDLVWAHIMQQHHDEALRTVAQVEAVWDAMAATANWADGPPPLESALRAHLDVVRGDVLKHLGRPREAVEATARGLERWEEVEAFSGFKVDAQNNLAEALKEVGRHEEAFAYYDRALETSIAELGEAHPRVATILNNRGGAHIEAGDYARGVADLERGRALQVSLDGLRHQNIALIDYNLGTVDLMCGRLESAQTRLHNAMDIWSEVLGPDHPFAQVGRMSQGALARERGELDRATALGRQSVQGLARVLSDNHMLTATALAELALTRAASGDGPEALALAERSLAGFEASSGTETPAAASAFVARAEARRAGSGDLGDLEAARADYERAVAIFTSAGDAHPELSWPHLGLAELAAARAELDTARAALDRAVTAADDWGRPPRWSRRVAAVEAALGDSR